MPYKKGKRTGTKQQKMVTRAITAAAKAKQTGGLTGTPRYGRNYPDGVNDAPKLPKRGKRQAGRDF